MTKLTPPPVHDPQVPGVPGDPGGPGGPGGPVPCAAASATHAIKNINVFIVTWERPNAGKVHDTNNMDR